MVRLLKITIITAFIGCTLAFAEAEADKTRVRVSVNGRVESITVGTHPLAITTDLRIPSPNWEKSTRLRHLSDILVMNEGGVRSWRGKLKLPDGTSCTFVQSLQVKKDRIIINMALTPTADSTVAGAFFWVDLPIPVFGGGRVELKSDGETVAKADLPMTAADPPRFLKGVGRNLKIASPHGKTVMSLILDSKRIVVVQDNRYWKEKHFSAHIQFAPQKLVKGRTEKLSLIIHTGRTGDPTEVLLTLTGKKAGYIFDGVGGNFCYGLDSPITEYMPELLRVTWARTQISLDEWEPENDNDRADVPNWESYIKEDRDGSHLRLEFVTARNLSERGLPIIASVWRLPEWLYAEPENNATKDQRRINLVLWNELIECIESYLIYAKKTYGIEPDMFSFNEPDAGINVLFSPEEHRRAVEVIGARFKKIGLKTRILLGDVSKATDTHTYVRPVIDSANARRHVGAIGIHTWGGATADDYRRWAEAAARAQLPLIITEFGIDPNAWRTKAYEKEGYAFRELRLFQELLLYAKPRAIIYWEYTADYPLLKSKKTDTDSGTILLTTRRFAIVKHFSNLTPPAARALATRSDHPDVLFTAFVGRAKNGARVYTMHISNSGNTKKKVRIRDIPKAIPTFQQVRTDQHDSFRTLAPVHVEDASVFLTLPPTSIVTLTTLRKDELPK